MYIADRALFPYTDIMDAKSERSARRQPLPELVKRVTSGFLILDVEAVTGSLEAITERNPRHAEIIHDAAVSLASVVSAATLPFQLIVDAVHQRRFDRFLSAERIRSRKGVNPTESPSDALEKRSFKKAQARMTTFLSSDEGADFSRDAVLEELNRGLNSPVISQAAQEMLNQALISTWGVFEHFVSRFVIDQINDHPQLAKDVLGAPDLKAYFGKPLLDIEALAEHGYDLTRSMGSIIFRGKRLDGLGVVRTILAAMFDDAEVREALGDKLWMLNQRRHLLVHKRGMIDQEYLKRTGDNLDVGCFLAITSHDVEDYLLTVQRAIIAVSTSGERLTAQLGTRKPEGS